MPCAVGLPTLRCKTPIPTCWRCLQIEAVLERSTSARARRSAEAMLTRQHRLLQAISRAQAVFIASAKPEAAFDALLDG